MKDALDYIETNPDEHESRLLAALVSDASVLQRRVDELTKERDEARHRAWEQTALAEIRLAELDALRGRVDGSETPEA